MKKDHLIFVLHAHLPYVKEPEIPFSIEETWFYETLTECYIPLYLIFEELKQKKVDFRMVMSLSPTLLEMMKDRYFIENYEDYLEMVIDITEMEMLRRKNTVFEDTVRFYNKRLINIRDTFHRLRKDIIGGFTDLKDNITFITTSATHAFLPILEPYIYGIHGQVKTGISAFFSSTGISPVGFWLPECGYSETSGEILKKNSIRWTILEGHGVLYGEPQPLYGIFRPVLDPSGLMIFPRDPEMCRLIWCSKTGYPKNPFYREFYKDLSHELSIREWKDISHGRRFSTGLKFYRITGREEKMPYIRDIAMAQIKKDAIDFYKRLKERFHYAGRFTDNPVITLAFDTELFGHWWFEGPEWLAEFLRIISDDDEIDICGPEDFIDQKDGMTTIKPLRSSWGGMGFYDTWVSPENSHLIKEIHKGIIMMRKILEDTMRKEKRSGVLEMYLKQAMRECLLMQASDLLFMIKGGEFREYAEKRFERYVKNLNELYSIIEDKRRLSIKRIKDMEMRESLFRDIDPYVFLEVS